MQIAHTFHTILIRNLPQLNLSSKSQARRFITLVDTLYDNKVRLVISSEVPLTHLFSAKKENTGISDEHRMLMDDLKISPGVSSQLGVSCFSSCDSLFSFHFVRNKLRRASSLARKRFSLFNERYHVCQKCRAWTTGRSGIRKWYKICFSQMATRCSCYSIERKLTVDWEEVRSMTYLNLSLRIEFQPFFNI